MTYIFGRDASAQTIRDLLAQKAAQGVKVRLIIDAFGSLLTRGKFFRPIVEAGGHVARFIPVLPIQTHTSANLRNHRKIAIFDSDRAIVGGQNIDNRFMGPTAHPDRFLDFSVHIAGPVVAAVQRVFLIDWAYAADIEPDRLKSAFAHQPAPAGESTIKVIVSGPDVAGDPLWDQIITLVQECRESATIVTPYFIPDEVLFRSLIVKARAGRKIRIVLPARSNHRLVDLARMHYLRQLHDAGVQILLHHGAVIHGKLLIIDGNTALVGSANVDLRSLFVNFEIGLLHTTPGDVATLQGWVDSLLENCQDFANASQARHRGFVRMAEDAAHLLAPLL